MGYSTDFKGAFRITPKVDTALACRLNLWFNSRHFKRHPFMEAKGIEASDDNLLFGKSSPNFMYFMPSLKQAVDNLIATGVNPTLAPHLLGNTIQDYRTENLFTHENITPELNEAYNTTPGNIPSLWSNLYIINDPDHDVSYLSWNQSEKSYSMAQWMMAIVNLLQMLNYHVDGIIEAQGEEQDDHWFMEVFDIHQLAQELDTFAYDTNTYEYKDQYDSREEGLQDMVNSLNDMTRLDLLITHLSEYAEEDMDNADQLARKLSRYRRTGTQLHVLDPEPDLTHTYQQEYMTAIKRSEKMARNTFDVPKVKELLSNPLSSLPVLPE